MKHIPHNGLSCHSLPLKGLCENILLKLNYNMNYLVTTVKLIEMMCIHSVVVFQCSVSVGQFIGCGNVRQ